MIEVLGLVIKGGQLVVSAARFLEDNKTLKSVESKLDSIRDSYLLTGIEYLRKSSICRDETNHRFYIESAHQNFTRASKIYKSHHSDEYRLSHEGVLLCELYLEEYECALRTLNVLLADLADLAGLMPRIMLGMLGPLPNPIFWVSPALIMMMPSYESYFELAKFLEGVCGETMVKRLCPNYKKSIFPYQYIKSIRDRQNKK